VHRADGAVCGSVDPVPHKFQEERIVISLFIIITALRDGDDIAAILDVPGEDAQQLDQPVHGHLLHRLQRLQLGRLAGQLARLVLGHQQLARDLSVIFHFP